MSFELKLRSWIYINFGSIKTFADELGISQTNISRYLNGSRKPGHNFYKQINNMGCDLNWLFDDDDKSSKSFLNKLKDNKLLLLLFSVDSFIDNSYICDNIILYGMEYKIKELRNRFPSF